MQEAKYLSGEVIRVGDSVRIGDWEATVEEVVAEECSLWNEYWRDETGAGVMLVGPKFGRLFTKFGDEDLVLVGREKAKK